MSTLLLSHAVLVMALMGGLWLLSIPLRNVSIVDIAWGIGFVVIAWATWARTGPHLAFGEPDFAPSAWLLPIATTLWGVRLTAYLAFRNHGRPEDKRYAAMRTRRGGGFWWQSLFIVFLLQGVVMWTISLPLQVGIAAARPGWSVLHGVGLAVWLVGWLFESIGDWQLARFKSHPGNAGRVCDRGLWRYTRHPNYFGDFCVWWGLWLIATAHGAAWWTVFSPALMSLFLLRVSGVTLLEQSLRAEKPDYAEYIRRTSAFFPRAPAD